jgi:cell wall-associated NlpC family hydrolase
MRTYTRVGASLFVGSAIVLTGLSGPAMADSSHASTVKVKRVDKSDSIISQAKKLKGKPYRYGGETPSGFDCSGYVQYVYKKAGTNVGRTSGAQLSGKSVPKSKKKPGDILIFMRGNTAYHSAIYAGDGKMWEAQRTGVPVGKHGIWSSSYVVRRPAGSDVVSTTKSAQAPAASASSPSQASSFAP